MWREVRHRTGVAGAILALLLLAACGVEETPDGTGAAGESMVVPEPFVVPAPPARPTSAEEIFPDVARRGLVLNNCATCHAIACVALGQRTPEEWSVVEATHTEAIPGMSKEDFGKAFDYLRRHFNDRTPEPFVQPEWLNGECTPSGE